MSCTFKPTSKKYGVLAIISFIGIFFTFMGSVWSIIGTCMAVAANTVSIMMFSKELCEKTPPPPAEPV